MRRCAILAGASALAMLATPPAHAQTVITPDTQTGVSTGSTATTNGNTTVIDGGRRIGDNLFHSFTNFSLGSGDTALWARSGGDGASIANVINRVTGGTVSTIDGRIATQGLNRANFFFINPAGVIFGANASVAVPNAAYFSTASSLRFADGGVFAVTTPNGSTFSMAAPSAFGFLGNQGDISIRGAGAGFVQPNTSLLLSAANITIDRSNFVVGSLDLSALGAASINIGLDQPLATRFQGGTLALSDSFITAEPSASSTGLLRVNAGRATLSNSILAADSNDRMASGVRLLVGDLVLRGSQGGAHQTYFGSFAPGIGNAGSVDIDALRITLSNSSQISSQALPGARGNAGDIRIRTGSLLVNSDASIISSAYGDSRSGNIAITADSIALTSGGLIESTTFGRGNGGDLTINTGSLSMDSGVIAAEAEQGATGNAGTIRLTASSLDLTNGARISSSNLGTGLGGVVNVAADTITLLNRSRIEADAVGPASGGAGDVLVTGRSIRLESGSEISSVTDGSGNAGSVQVTADSLVIDDGAINSAALGGTAAAGVVGILANSLDIRNNGEITTSTLGTGAAGFIVIGARSINLASGGRITSETFARGSAGNIIIGPRDGLAPNISLAGGATISSSQAGGNATGDTGAILITARLLQLSGDSAITSSSEALGGASGGIIITADNLQIRDSRIETNSDNRNSSGVISVEVGDLTVDRGTIRSENGSRLRGAAGDILIEGQRIALLNGGNISTDSLTGPAGNIVLTLPPTGTILLQGAAQSGVITTSSGQGTGGVISISSPYLILSDGGQILALGDAFGAAVLLQSDFYIRSFDRLNLLSVDGDLLVDSQVGDLSTGVQSIDLSFLDASSVLRGQCAATRRGGVNQLNLRATGPYAGVENADRRAMAGMAGAPSGSNLCGQ